MPRTSLYSASPGTAARRASESTANRALPAHHRSAEELLAEIPIVDPSGLDLDLIAQHCKATTVYERLVGCDARIAKIGSRAFISIDPSVRRERQRFCIAHEIGHWMLGGWTGECTALSVYGRGTRDPVEAAANRYAVDLIMPSFMFAPLARDRTATFETIRELAATFETSLEATAARFAKLGSVRALFLRFKVGRDVWPSRHVGFPRPFEPPSAPPPGSIAYDILHGGNDVATSCDVPADVWFRDAGARHFWVQESSIRTGRDCILTLLEWTLGRQAWQFGEDSGSAS